MRRIAAFVVALACLLVPTVALADGDPGSDVLLEQNLFASATSGISISQQLQLGKLLDQTTSIGAPVRVAVIAHKDDLGADTGLWQEPQKYSAFLATELSLTYDGRLLVVMPNGYGFYWYGHDKQINSVAASLAKLPPPGAALVSGTESTVRAVELATGVSASNVQALGKAGPISGGTQPAGSVTTQAHASGRTEVVRADATLASNAAAVPEPLLKSGSSNGALGSTLIAIAILVIALLLIVYRWRLAIPGLTRLQGRPHLLMALPLVALLAVAGVISLTHDSSDTAVAGTLASNPSLDGGTSLYGRAPNFTLTDEKGKQISLNQYRGKVVVLSFVDSECQTICPLTTAAMLDAKRELGPAGKDVQLLGVNANWKSDQVDDVLNYSEDHGLMGHWHFLTGTLGQLSHVWNSYKINEYQLDKKTNTLQDIDHISSTFLITPNGQVAKVFQTQASYSSIPQFGQLLAEDASDLLPGHPRVRTHYSFGHVVDVTPTQTTTVPNEAGGSLQLGPGKPHLYLFFDTWDTQTTSLGGELDELNSYEQASRAKGLPPLTAIDEGSVEPSSRALPSFLQSLRKPLSYPVGIDTTGQLADGYDVTGQPWFVETDAHGTIVWEQEVYTEGWPTLPELDRDVNSSLKGGLSYIVSPKQARKELAGSPAPLGALHKQAATLLPGGQAALDKRIKSLAGFPVVVNIWGSWCKPCQDEFGLFATASAQYGSQVAFIGADFNEHQAGAGTAFLRSHHVSYPSYLTTVGSITNLLPGGVEATPTTLYFSSTGKLLFTKEGQYGSQDALDQDIETYALNGTGQTATAP